VSWENDIRSRLTEAEAFLEDLQSGRVHIGPLSGGGTEARIANLRRKIAEYKSILDRQHA
jgi:hypothetical protein